MSQKCTETSVVEIKMDPSRRAMLAGNSDAIAQSYRANFDREVRASASIPKKEVSRTLPTESWLPC
jgi:hypothetical protein